MAFSPYFRWYTVCISAILGAIPHGFSQSQCEPFKNGTTISNGGLRKNIMISEHGINAYGWESYNDVTDTKSTYTPLITSENLWMFGYDPSGFIKFLGGLDPKVQMSGGYFADDFYLECMPLDTIFKVTRTEIIQAIDIIDSGGDCRDLPTSILSWPGRGNPMNAQFIMDESIKAAFYDQNGDDLYNPCEGDLPFLPLEQSIFDARSEIAKRFPCELTFHSMVSENNPIGHLTPSATIFIGVNNYHFTYDHPGLSDVIFEIQHINNFQFTDTGETRIGYHTVFDMDCVDEDRAGYHLKSHTLYGYVTSTDQCIGKMQGIGIATTLIHGPWAPKIIVEGDSIRLLDPLLGSGWADTIINLPMDQISIYTCDPMDTCLNDTLAAYLNIMQGLHPDGNNYVDLNGNVTFQPFSGNPANPDDYSMCTTTGQEALSAMMATTPMLLMTDTYNFLTKATFTYLHDPESCPDDRLIADKANEIKSIFKDLTQTPSGPPAPRLSVTSRSNGSITLNVIDIPYGYADRKGHTGIEHRFEGIQIYQVAHQDVSLHDLGDPHISQMIYQGDITNSIDEVGYWKPIIINGQLDYIYEVTVPGNNSGIDNTVTIDYDYLNDKPLHADSSYYYVAKSYAYTPATFETMTGHGNRYEYWPTSCCTEVVKSDITSNTNSPKEAPHFEYTISGGQMLIHHQFNHLEIGIYDITGRLLVHQKHSGQHEAILDLGQLLCHTGVYIISLQDKDTGIVLTDRFLFGG